VEADVLPPEIVGDDVENVGFAVRRLSLPHLRVDAKKRKHQEKHGGFKKWDRRIFHLYAPIAG
jgi:hypothetical protein